MKSWEVTFCTLGTVCVCVCALTCWGEIEENMFGKGSIGHKYKKIKIKDKVSNFKELPIFRESWHEMTEQLQNNVSKLHEA